MFCDKSGERGDVLGGSGVVRPVKQVHCACVGFIVIGEVSRGVGELRDKALRRCRFQSCQNSKRSGFGNCEGSIELGLTVQSMLCCCECSSCCECSCCTCCECSSCTCCVEAPLIACKQRHMTCHNSSEAGRLSTRRCCCVTVIQWVLLCTARRVRLQKPKSLHPVHRHCHNNMILEFCYKAVPVMCTPVSHSFSLPHHL